MTTTYDAAISPSFDPGSETYSVSYDTDSALKLSTTLVLSVGAVTGDDPTEMPPLHWAVDPEEVESHVREQSGNARLTFEFHGYDVSVRDDGRIEFAPLEDRGS